MSGRFLGRQFTSFQIITAGFLAVILVGALLLALPLSSAGGEWTAAEDALFTAASAVCVTGLVVRDTATCWSGFGQAVILILIQIGGVGIVTITALVATSSGRKISLLQRSMLQESISAHQLGGVVKLSAFICKVSLLTEAFGAILLRRQSGGRNGVPCFVAHRKRRRRGPQRKGDCRVGVYPSAVRRLPHGAV